MAVAQPASVTKRDTHNNLIPIPHEELRRLLNYNPETGRFTRLVAVSIIKKYSVGSVAGFKHSQGYRIIKLGAHRIWEHRLAIFYMTGNWPKEVDHINRVKDDNRFINLRDVSGSDNQHNRDVSISKSKAGLMGAYLQDGRYKSVINYRGQKVYLGMFGTAKEAHAAYLAARTERGLNV